MRRLIVWWYSYRRGGSDARSLRRVLRRESIISNKKEIVRDLMTGHNIGDFEMTREDLTTFLRMGDNPPYFLLLKLYKTYRGNDLTYRD